MSEQPQTYRWRDPNLPPNAPALHMYFLNEPAINHAATLASGIQTYDNVLVAYVAPTPQSKSNIAHEIRRTLPDGTVVENKALVYKYAEQLKHFDANTSAESLGTPLKELVTMTPGMIMNLKSRGIATIETLAELPDSAGQELMGFWELRERAKKHLEHREKNAPMAKLEAMEEAHRKETDSLRRQLEDLQAAVGAPEKRGPGRPKQEAA